MSNLVPEGWSVKKVVEFTEEHKQGYYTKNPYSEQGTYLIRITDLNNPKIDYSDMPRLVVDEKEYDQFKVQIGDFLFARSGAIGRYGIVSKSYPSVFASYLIRFRFDDSLVSTRYFGYAYESDICQSQLAAITQGSSNININADNIKSLSVAFPPLPEQKKIAAILTSVDDVIEKTQAQIDKLKALKTGMMQELLTRGVGVDGKPHTEFKDSPVGRIPKGWEVEALKEFTSFLSYGFTNPMPEAENGPYMITAKDINNLKIQYSAARKTSQEAYDDLLTRKSRPEMNDILLTKDGSLGRVALVTESNCCINQSVAVITPNSRVIPKFLLYLLASPAYQQEMLDKAGGSTIKHIYITVVDKMLVAVPSLEEQEKLVAIFDSVFCKLELAEKKFNKLKNTKKALMQDLLTGKVRVKVDS
ncbi:hypothetical protein BCT47_20275 [Vibrio splendidus]|uniref:Restriction endonuclease subunit S n=1 Tax=Vibrio splendidus TaxID=29497 RepID=A0AB35N2H7_VIBSP|nr:restriction endonuclease subunit S [Vibrio splendidus]MDP2503066.1 restriction endonuclease subunit S [Vibrio splendidus]PMM75072.1 hypothetical protein BCT47_20275 [Vibrio splendidus]